MIQKTTTAAMPAGSPSARSPLAGIAAVAGLALLCACASSGGAAVAASAQEGDAAVARDPLAADEGEARVLAVLEAMGADADRRHLSVSRADGRLLRQLAESMGAERVVEVGTSTGYSGLWLALALRATNGHLSTHELDPGRAATARENFERAGVSDLVTVIVGDAHETVERHEAPIDLVFLDADKPGYVDYLEKLLPELRSGGLVVAHNMRVPPPDPRYVEAVTSDPDLETTFVLMEGPGLGITLKKR